jgi:hypothetical protein
MREVVETGKDILSALVRRNCPEVSGAAGVAAILCASTGCPTIVNDTTEEVSLSST